MKKSMLFLGALTMTLLVFSLSREMPVSAKDEADITVLIETADSPEDHLKIAEYYDEQVVITENKITLHESMAEAYEGGKMAGMSTHCRNLVKELKAAVEQYKAMAAEHRKMAHQAQGHDAQKPQ